jgi:mxaJ protein
MSSSFPETSLALAICASLIRASGMAAANGTQTPANAVPVRELRICSDPNNLPFSNRRLEGFENKIAEIVARDLGARISYTWWAQRRGFFRNTLKAGLCDVVLGVPTGMERAVPTRPYYRSTYVFVSRADRGLDVRSFDDPALRNLRIGVQLAGDDYANTPPAHALSRRGIVANVVGFTLYGDYGKENPPARIVEAVARGEIDIAVVWGPLAGWFARKQSVPLRIVPVSPAIDRPFLPFVYDIAVGVRRGDDELRNTIDAELERRRGEIDAILDAYGVPRVAVGDEGGAR